MSSLSNVEVHPRRLEIEALLAARAPLSVIVKRFGVSRFSAGRHRQRMKATDKATWRALRRAAAEAGLKRADFIPASVPVALTAESPTP